MRGTLCSVLRFSSSVALSLFVALVACSSDDPENTALASDGSTRTVTCNGKVCRGDDYCCGSTDWGDAACAPSCGEKHPMYCDEASDCGPGEQCCFVLENSNSVVESRCATVCPIQEDRGQLCSDAAKDCEDGVCTAMPVAPTGLSQCVKN